MQIVEGKEQEYKSCFDKNADPYSRRCFTYAEEWASLLEKRIPGGASEAEITGIFVIHAKADSHTADTDGITGFMYGAAVSILAWAWEYGEILRKWHNLESQIGNEGEEANRNGGTLNPALLKIGKN